MQPIYAAFREVAPTIEAFARSRDLPIERYRREAASWTLRFARHLGGEASIVVSYREATGHAFDVAALWWIDDYPARTRRVKSAKVGTYLKRDPRSGLNDMLEAALTHISSWTLDDLGRAIGPYRWRSSREEWEADLALLPRR